MHELIGIGAVPTESDAWWTASLPSESTVIAVSITSRSDCCSNSISGARIMLGNESWVGLESIENFVDCAEVPEERLYRGLRTTLKCAAPTVAKHVAVYLPKTNTSLSICEVDAMLS